MKKVFLLFGIAAFTSASAQQKDVFDIQKHLDKIVKDKKFPGAVTNPFSKSNFLLHHGALPQVQELLHVLSNGDNVYTLSQDNMPCVVPGMSQFNMPNISNPGEYFESLQFKQHLPGTIPNAVKPYRLIVSK
jgi:hypothetical protein